MNERIQKLAEQSGISYLSSVHPDMWEKFAELIVKECANFVSNDRQNDDYGVFVANRIKQHFGVEE